MENQLSWKILVFVCGDATSRLPAQPEQVNLAALLHLPALPAGVSSATLVVQAHKAGRRQGVRLVQPPGQMVAHLVELVEAVPDSPIARDAFALWAMQAYPTSRTVLLLSDCQTQGSGRYPLRGTAFELTASGASLIQRPLSETSLEELVAALQGAG